MSKNITYIPSFKTVIAKKKKKANHHHLQLVVIFFQVKGLPFRFTNQGGGC